MHGHFLLFWMCIFLQPSCIRIRFSSLLSPVKLVHSTRTTLDARPLGGRKERGLPFFHHSVCLSTASRDTMFFFVSYPRYATKYWHYLSGPPSSPSKKKYLSGIQFQSSVLFICHKKKVHVKCKCWLPWSAFPMGQSKHRSKVARTHDSVRHSRRSFLRGGGVAFAHVPFSRHFFFSRRFRVHMRK